jgi:tyrosine-specific transport protein
MFNKTLSGTLLVAGTTIGAGMLGIPLLTAKAGFFPAVGITVAVWLFMLATGYLYLEATLWMHEGANVLSISKRFLGRGGKWLAGSTYLFYYMCLMVAYFAAGAPLFAACIKWVTGIELSGAPSYIVYGFVFGAIVAFGLKFIDRLNYILMLAMALSYFALLGTGLPALSLERYAHYDLSQVLFSAPVLFSAFGFQNVIPSLVTYFNRNVRVLRRSLFWGTFIPLIVYIAWQGLILGAAPLSSIESALLHGQPATEALQSLTQSPWVVLIGQYFAFFAIITSMLGVAFSMVDFLADGLHISEHGGSKRGILSFATFAVALLFSSLDPAVFVTALGIAGGFGGAILNGLVPVGMVWVGRYKRRLEGAVQLLGGKWMLAALFGGALLAVALEIVFLCRGE